MQLENKRIPSFRSKMAVRIAPDPGSNGNGEINAGYLKMEPSSIQPTVPEWHSIADLMKRIEVNKILA